MSRGTLDPASCNSDFTYGTFTLSGLTSQTVLLSYCSHVAVRTPERTRSGLGSSVFARRYSQNRCFFLFLLLLRCFSSEGFLHMAMYLPCSDTVLPYRVSPFGYLRIKTRVQFPEAFRSLPRPSSPDRAKASFMCP